MTKPLERGLPQNMCHFNHIQLTTQQGFQVSTASTYSTCTTTVTPIALSKTVPLTNWYTSSVELTQSPQDHTEVGPSPSVQANINESTRQNKTSTVPYKIDVLNPKFLQSLEM